MTFLVPLQASTGCEAASVRGYPYTPKIQCLLPPAIHRETEREGEHSRLLILRANTHPQEVTEASVEPTPQGNQPCIL